MKIIGLTGSIGMGKSTTARMFEKLGIPVFDADAVVRHVQGPGGTAIPALREAFPDCVEGDCLNRVALRDRVFADPDTLAQLEAIIHPLVASARQQFFAEAKATFAPAVVLDVPLLFETGMDQNCDFIVVASAPESIQKERVLARDGMTESVFEQILTSQMSDAEKRKHADFIVETGRGLDIAEDQVRCIIEKVKVQNA